MRQNVHKTLVNSLWCVKNCTTFKCHTERDECVEISLRQSSDVRNSSQINRSTRCASLSDWRFPSGKRARAGDASTFEESPPISLPVRVKRLRDVALNKLRVRIAGATRRAPSRRVANNFRTVVYLRSFSTSEKATAQHRRRSFPSFFFSPSRVCVLWVFAM